MNPRHSMRKIFGLYEHELNNWLEESLRRVNRVLDVGANDGYFTFGCFAAFRRLKKASEIIAFEPQDQPFADLQQSAHARSVDTTQIRLIQSFVGRESREGMMTLDSIRWQTGDSLDRTGTLVKIDVEGAEIDVLMGARSWINANNLFLIEVHRRAYLETIVSLFADNGVALERIDHRPLSFIGGEYRDRENWWLVSHLDGLVD
jgi:hypothetical protein